MDIRRIIKEELKTFFEGGFSNIKLQRCQKNEVEGKWDFNISDGQHGRGVYAFLKGDEAMVNYYCQFGDLYDLEIPKSLTKDISHKDWEYWNLKTFIYQNPQYKAFILKHEGHGIPTSKEVLITDPSIIIFNGV